MEKLPERPIISLAPVFMPHAGETLHPFQKIRTWEITDTDTYTRLQSIECEITKLLRESDKLIADQGVEITDVP